MMSRISTIIGIPIYSYGTCIAIGLALFVYCVHRDRSASKILTHNHIDMITLGLVGASICGSKLLSTVLMLMQESPHVRSALMHSGLSISGGVIAGMCTSLAMTRYYQLPIMHVLDTFATYMPIIHMFGRIGCLLAGCCHGYATDNIMHIIYTDPESWAPLYTPLVPIQGYIACWYAISFIILWSAHTYISLPRGTIFALYIITFACARSIMDLFRADYAPAICGISYAQAIALAIVGVGIIVLLYSRYHDTRT